MFNQIDGFATNASARRYQIMSAYESPSSVFKKKKSLPSQGHAISKLNKIVTHNGSIKHLIQPEIHINDGGVTNPFYIGSQNDLENEDIAMQLRQMKSEEIKVTEIVQSQREINAPKYIIKRSQTKKDQRSVVDHQKMGAQSLISIGSNGLVGSKNIKPPKHKIFPGQKHSNNDIVGFYSPDKDNKIQLIPNSLTTNNYIQNAKVLNLQKKIDHGKSIFKIHSITPQNNNSKSQFLIKQQLQGSSSLKTLGKKQQGEDSNFTVANNTQQLLHENQQNEKNNNQGLKFKKSQIKAAVIRNFKLQNNFQVSFTNSFMQTSQTEAQSPMKRNDLNTQPHIPTYQTEVALQNVLKIDMRLNDELEKIKDKDSFVTSKKKFEIYLKALDEVATHDTLFRPILTRVKKGFKDCFKKMDSQINELKLQLSRQSEILRVKGIELDKVLNEFKEYQRNEDENLKQIQNMAKQIDEKEDIIERLEQEVQSLRLNVRQSFKDKILNNKSDGSDNNQLENLKKENEELRAIINDIQEEIDYGKQRENKLMYFLFVLKENGYPISDIFEKEIKDLQTNRFSSNFNEEYKLIYDKIKKERKRTKKEAQKEQFDGFGIIKDEKLGFISERVFTSNNNQSISSILLETPVTLNASQHVLPPQKQKKPSIIPILDIYNIPKCTYSSSSDDNDKYSHSQQIVKGPNPRQVKQILDKYNIHTCARNLKLQKRQIQINIVPSHQSKIESFCNSSEYIDGSLD